MAEPNANRINERGKSLSAGGGIQARKAELDSLLESCCGGSRSLVKLAIPEEPGAHEKEQVLFEGLRRGFFKKTGSPLRWVERHGFSFWFVAGVETLLKLCSQVYQQKRWIDRYQMRRAIGPKKTADTCTKKRAGKVGLNLRLCAGRSGGLSSECLTVAVIVRTRKEWRRRKGDFRRRWLWRGRLEWADGVT